MRTVINTTHLLITPAAWVSITCAPLLPALLLPHQPFQSLHGPLRCGCSQDATSEPLTFSLWRIPYTNSMPSHFYQNLLLFFKLLWLVLLPDPSESYIKLPTRYCLLDIPQANHMRLVDELTNHPSHHQSQKPGLCIFDTAATRGGG